MRYLYFNSLSRIFLKSIFILVGLVLLVALTTQTVTDGLAGRLGMQSAPTDNAWVEIGGVVLYLMYTLWLLLRPRAILWSHWRFTYTYLLSIFVLSLIVGSFASPLLRLFGFIVIFCVVLQARAAFGRRGLWLVLSVLLLTALLDTVLMREVGSETATLWTPLQLVLLLVGLAFVQTFTGLGVQERAARMRNEELVTELRTTQEQLRTYAVHAEELATMRERTRIAREIHDTLAQGLVAIKMQLETGQVLLDTSPQDARQHIEYACKLAGEHLHEARTSILELRTDALHGQSLSEALTTLVATWKPKQITSDAGAYFHMEAPMQEIPIVPVVGPALYRVAQEALQNATRHGHASRVEIELSLEAEMLCLTITDDGTGFDPATIRQSGTGFGMLGMHERMRLLKGSVDILSTPGAGTQVVAMVPIHAVSETEPLTTQVGGYSA